MDVENYLIVKNGENFIEINKDKISMSEQYYAPNLNQENVQAFSVKYPSSAGDKYSISAITSDNQFSVGFGIYPTIV
ncbi:MAG: hypothetical protein ACM65M_05555 [Microcoleus sp.]